MEVRCIWVRVARETDITQDVAPLQKSALFEAVQIAIEVRIIEASLLAHVELIHGVSARFAEEELLYHPVDYRVHGRTSRRRNIDRFVLPVAAACLRVGVLDICLAQACDR